MSDRLTNGNSRHRSALVSLFAVSTFGALLIGGVELVVAGRVVGSSSAVPSTPDATTTATSTSTTTTTTTTTTTVALTLEGGVFTALDGSFSVAFAVTPSRTVDDVNRVESYLVNIEEDSQSVASFPLAALNAPPGASPTTRSDVFLAASGTDIDVLANSASRLGPFPAAYFIARMTLASGRRAAIYGIVVTRESDVVYVVYTDVAADDNEAATSFVESYTVLFDRPPTPTTPATPTTTTTTVPTATTTTATTAVPTSSTRTDATIVTPSSGPASSTLTPPDGATVSYDSAWWVTFPDGVEPTFRASTENGFAYAEYLAEAGEDTLTVRITEVPEGYEWDVADFLRRAAAHLGAGVWDVESVDIDGRDAVRFTLVGDAPGGRSESDETLRGLVVNGGAQIYELSFDDRGLPSPADADAFLGSLVLT